MVAIQIYHSETLSSFPSNTEYDVNKSLTRLHQSIPADQVPESNINSAKIFCFQHVHDLSPPIQPTLHENTYKLQHCTSETCSNNQLPIHTLRRLPHFVCILCIQSKHPQFCDLHFPLSVGATPSKRPQSRKVQTITRLFLIIVIIIIAIPAPAPRAIHRTG